VLDLGPDGRIAVVTVFIRPVSALVRFGELMAARLGEPPAAN